MGFLVKVLSENHWCHLHIWIVIAPIQACISHESKDSILQCHSCCPKEGRLKPNILSSMSDNSHGSTSTMKAGAPIILI